MTLPDPHALLQALISGVLLGGLYACGALGLSLVLGVMRLVNLVHGELVVLGSYLGFVALSAWGLDPLLALPLVFLVVAAVGYPLHRTLLAPLARGGEEGPLLTAFALSIILQNLFIRVFTGDTRSLDRPYTRTAISLAGYAIPTIYLVGFLISLLVTTAVYLVMTRTSFGRQLRASAEDPLAASIVGVAVGRVHGLTYALAAGLAAVGGILIALCFSFTPTSGTEYLLTAFTIVVLGGLGSVYGTFAGGLTLGVLQSVGAVTLGDGYRTFVGLVLFLVILAVRPQGLFRRGATA
jgi:branched-chain amino acid transport system permease protein